MSEIIVRKVNEATIHIDSNDLGILQEMREYFTFVVPGHKFMPTFKNKMWDGKIRLYDTRTKTLPYGLYDYVLIFCKQRDYKCSIIGIELQDNAPDLTFIDDLMLSIKGKLIKPLGHQNIALEHALKKEKSLLLSPTGSGKSLIIYCLLRWYLQNFENNIILIVPTTSLVEQMYSDFEDYSGLDNSFNVENECHKIYAGKDKFKFKQRVTLTTWQSIYKMPKKWFENYGMVIGDEAHTFKAKSLTSIMQKLENARYRIGTSGTLDGLQMNKLVLEGCFGRVFDVTSTKDLMDKGLLSKLKINTLLLKYNKEDRKICPKNYADEVDFIVKHRNRNNFIKNLALSVDGNTLLLFRFVDKHGKPLYELIKSSVNKDRKVFYVSGETDVGIRDNVRKLTEKESNAIIVASLGTFSTGINIKNIHNIIFATPNKSQISILQSIGRGLRKSDDNRSTTLYDIADNLTHGKRENYALKHASERLKIYVREKFTFKIHNIDI